jgi:hypothetical protein
MSDLLEVEFDCFPMEWGGYAEMINTIGGWLVTSWPGGRIDPIRGGYGDHGGIDLIRKYINAMLQTHAAPFYSVLPGRVSQGWDPGGGGWWTGLRTDAGHYVGYGHALKFAPGVNGQHVPAGTLLGWINSSGGSTGDHMHFAVNAFSQGRYDDPTGPLRRVAARGSYPSTYIVGGAPVIPNKPEDEDMALSSEDLAKIGTQTQSIVKATQDFLSARIEQAGTAGQVTTQQLQGRLEASGAILPANVKELD